MQTYKSGISVGHPAFVHSLQYVLESSAAAPSAAFLCVAGWFYLCQQIFIRTCIDTHLTAPFFVPVAVAIVLAPIDYTAFKSRAVLKTFHIIPLHRFLFRFLYRFQN